MRKNFVTKNALSETHYVKGNNATFQPITTIIKCKKIILSQKSVGVEIDVSDAIKNVDTIVVNDLEFVKKGKANYCEAPEDVERKKEIERLEYTLEGVMHSVDKWLEGDELKQDEVNRAITMREKTLQIIEKSESEVKRLSRDLAIAENAINNRNIELERMRTVESVYKRHCKNLAGKIFGEIDKLHLHVTDEVDLRRYEKLKKKYTEDKQ